MLLDIEPLKKIIRLTLQTGYIKTSSAPVSLLLIANPESAKTSAMELFKVKGTYTTNNITQSVLVSKILPMIENEKLKHLIIPDILNCIEKSKTTREGFVNLIKSLIEEGITSLDQFNVRTNKIYNPPIKCGVITGITSGSYNGYYNNLTQRTEGGLKHYWKKIGLLSRFVPFSYKYELSKVIKIFELIEKDNANAKENQKETIKRTVTEIEGNEKLFNQLQMVSVKVGQEVEAYGIRIQKNLQLLAKANALLRNSPKVEQEDIQAILDLSNWINYDFNPL